MHRSGGLFSLLIVLSLLFCGIRFFTEEVYLKDDPTVALRLHVEPGLPNFAPVDALDQPGRIILMRDENALVTGGVYRWIVGWGWIAMLVLTLGYAALTRKRA